MSTPAQPSGSYQDWRTVPSRSYRGPAGPRSPPTIANGRVYTFGAQGVLSCLDFNTGKKIWSVETHRQFQVPKGYFGAAGSPLVANGEVVINVGGGDGAGVVGFDEKTGAVAWQATDHPAGYSAASAQRSSVHA